MFQTVIGRATDRKLPATGDIDAHVDAPDRIATRIMRERAVPKRGAVRCTAQFRDRTARPGQGLGLHFRTDSGYQGLSLCRLSIPEPGGTRSGHASCWLMQQCQVVASARHMPHLWRMPEPLSTTGYDNVVLIDSQVVLEARPLDQLPWTELFTGTILLLVTRQVQTEIDRRKNDPRLGKRARAFNKLLDGFITHRVPSPVLTDPRVDVATVANRPIDWSAIDDLDRDDSDDRIVAQALNALVDEPGRLVLLSHDMRPRDAAATHGLSAVRLPETWLREPEPTPAERRITELEAKIRLLSASQPEVTVRLAAITPALWAYREVGEVSTEQASMLRNLILYRAPRPPRDPFGNDMMVGDYDFGSRFAEWERGIRRNIPLLHRGLTRLYAQHRLCVSIENVGSIPAESLSLEIRSGNALLHSVPYGVLLTGPRAPRPRPFHHALLGNLGQLSPAIRRLFEFYWDERGPGSNLMLSCGSFRQEKLHEVEVSVELLPQSAPKAHIEAVVTASNLKGDVRARLVQDVEQLSVRPDDLFSFSKQTVEIPPPFTWTPDASGEDLVWYNNDGTRFRDD